MLRCRNCSGEEVDEISTIRFADPELEDAVIIRCYLDIIHGDFATTGSNDLAVASKLLAFLDEVEGTRVQYNAVLASLLNYGHDHLDLPFAFHLSAKYDNEGVARALFVGTEGRVWNGNEETRKPKGIVEGSLCLSPSSMPPEYLHHLPSKYVWALTRAYIKDQKEERIKEFNRSLKLWKKNEANIQTVISEHSD